MTRENSKKPKHKSPKFKESQDEDFSWEDKIDFQNRKKKPGKKFQRKNVNKDKW